MFLGIDIGTSAVKTLVVDGEQRIVASASAAVSTSRPHELWSEQDPEDWWHATEAAVSELRRKAGKSWAVIRAIGLSGQMHSAVLVDASRNSLRPAILHNDGRSFAEAEALNEAVPDLGRIAGVPAMPGFTAPKLLWLRHHEPDVLARTAQVLLPKDFVRLRMTGSFATDMCDAAGSLLFDCGNRRWSGPIAAACGIGMALLPPVLEGSHPAGLLHGSVAGAWGLTSGTVVAAGTGDVAAGAIGLGAINEGDTHISLGTAAQYFITRESYHPAPQHLIHTFCHGLPGRYFQMAALLNGASCLAWAAALLGEKDVGQLLAKTEAAFSKPSFITFLPYLTGERTPHNNPHARGVLFGLTPATTPAEVMLAVMEGVALSVADCQGYLAETGPLPQQISVIGGGSRNRFWMKLLASALGRTIILHEGGEAGPAFGAARLARLAVTGEERDAVCTKPTVAATIEPDPTLAVIYAERLVKFRSLYQAVAGQF